MSSKYQNSKIYKIINEEMPNVVYYGSTIRTLNKRLNQHKNDCKKRNKSSKPLFEFGEPKIILIQNKPCNNRQELLKREAFYIKNFECINKNIPGRTIKEWENENKDKLRDKSKKYREENKDKIKERKKKYREENKEKINEKRRENCECECGGKFSNSNRARHLKTKKHLDFINN